METGYIGDFQKFLDYTNEKEVLLAEITEELRRHQCRSLLDVGAGNGLMAIPLSRQVSKYTAVETKKEYALALREAGLEVINSAFPIELSQKYDAVLFSHVFSYLHPDHEEFINAAWQFLNQNGVLVIVTYRGEEDDWTRLIKQLGLLNPGDYPAIFENMVNLLSSLGKTTVRKVVTTVKADNIEDMIAALSFVASNGVPERKQKFMTHREEIVAFLENYKTDDGFAFPFQHFILVTEK
ncbi:MAG: methyltransferase domain-containing protein [Patescibacteria group bacterium]